MTSRPAYLAVGLAVTLLFAAFWLFRDQAPASPSPGEISLPTPAGSPTGTALEELRRALAEEREHSGELSAEVDWLRYQLTVLAELAAEEEPQEPGEEPDRREFPKPGTPLLFEGDELHAAGIPLNDIDRLREIFDESEMEVLELMHQAQRDGTYGKRPYNRMLRDLRVGLRREIGDDDFDLLLFATGRANRVAVAAVIGSSPAENWGLKPGDLIIHYGDRRIFNPRELQRQTIRGDRGDRVTIDVLREGERIRLYGIRGPMGVKLEPSRRLPESGW
jgi:hypothetical protein